MPGLCCQAPGKTWMDGTKPGHDGFTFTAAEN